MSKEKICPPFNISLSSSFCEAQGWWQVVSCLGKSTVSLMNARICRGREMCTSVISSPTHKTVNTKRIEF